jgi:UDP-glucose 4-epimerase
VSRLRPTTLVTGGAGFIGSELVRQLVDRGHRVVVIDNLVNGKRENLSDLRTDRVVLVEQDIRDIDGVFPHLRESSVVYHLACLGVRHSLREPIENHDVNATGTLRLLQASRQAGVPRFVYVSSSEVYGTANSVPMTEEHPTFPSTVYGSSKLAGECYARTFHRTYGYATVVVRPFNTYGPRSHHEGDSGEVVPKFVLRCLAGRPMVVFGDGRQTRDFTYITDSARGIILAGTADQAIGETINLGTGVEVSINDLAAAVSMVTGHRAPRVTYEPSRPGDVLRLCANASKAEELLGYRPTVSLEKGLRHLLDWYRLQGTSPEDLLRDEVVRSWEMA